jgi:hypothetical protein
LPLYLTGLGGVGKSALVAALQLALQKSKTVTLLVDFDAVGLGAGEPMPVFLTIMHQFALFVRARGHEAIADQLSAARTYIQAKTRQSGTGNLGAAMEEQFATIDGLGLSALAKVPSPMRREPIVLILDSFEVVPARQLPAVMRLFELLQQRLPLPGLRLIISGRELPPTTVDLLSPPVTPDPAHHMVLEGLEEKDAARFLAVKDTERKFKSRSLRLRAARALRGHPLSLQILARLARSQPLNEIESALSDLERDPHFAAEFAQSYLYTRVLDRIADPKIKDLAHPGLILREVTPGLIRIVLAGPCKLGDITDTEATDLLHRLSEHYWLVQTLGTDHLRHRADVRRMMVPAMLAGPRPDDPPTIAERKHKAQQSGLQAATSAAKFWREGPVKGDSAQAFFDTKTPQERWAEATYYGALAGEPPPTRLTREQATALESGIGKDDLEILKPSWRGEIKVALDNFDELAPNEIDMLGVDSREQYETNSIDRMRKSGAPKDAAEMARAEEHRARQHRQLEEAQVLLRDAGYYMVRIDGVLGPAMRRALTDLGVKLALDAGTELLLREVRRRVKKQGAKQVESAGAEAPDATPEPTAPTPPRREEMSVALAESLTASEFESGECKPEAVELLIQNLLNDKLSPATHSEIDKGRLWNTGLWKGALVAAARKMIAPDRFDWASGLGRRPTLDAAVILVSGLFGPMPEMQRREHFEWLVSRRDGRLEGNDGLRLLLRIARAKGGTRKMPIVSVDGSALALLAENGLVAFATRSGQNTGWLNINRNSAPNRSAATLIMDGSALDRFTRLLKQRTIVLGDFEAAWQSNCTVWANVAQVQDAAHAELQTLRIQSPELVLPVTHILNQINPVDAAEVVNGLAKRAPCWPRELWFCGPGLPDEHAKSARPFNPEICFAAVQTLDRCGMVGSLLDMLAKSPSAPPTPTERVRVIHAHLIRNFALTQRNPADQPETIKGERP